MCVAFSSVITCARKKNKNTLTKIIFADKLPVVAGGLALFGAGIGLSMLSGGSAIAIGIFVSKCGLFGSVGGMMLALAVDPVQEERAEKKFNADYSDGTLAERYAEEILHRDPQFQNPGTRTRVSRMSLHPVFARAAVRKGLNSGVSPASSVVTPPATPNR